MFLSQSTECVHAKRHVKTFYFTQVGGFLSFFTCCVLFCHLMDSCCQRLTLHQGDDDELFQLSDHCRLESNCSAFYWQLCPTHWINERWWWENISNVFWPDHQIYERSKLHYFQLAVPHKLILCCRGLLFTLEPLSRIPLPSWILRHVSSIFTVFRQFTVEINWFNENRLILTRVTHKNQLEYCCFMGCTKIS